MENHSDTSLTRSDTSPNALTETFTTGQEYGPNGESAPNAHPIPDNLNSSSDVHLDPGWDDTCTKTCGSASPSHAIKSSQEHAAIKTIKTSEHQGPTSSPQSNSNEDHFKELASSQHYVSPLGDSASATWTNIGKGLDDRLFDFHQGAPSSPARTSPLDEREESDDRIQMLQEAVCDGGLPHMTDGDIPEDADYPCDDFPSSLPPSSSPPPLLSSSPCVSSQSSVQSTVSPPKMVQQSIGVKDFTSSHDCPRDEAGSKDKFDVGPRSSSIADVATPPDVREYWSEISPSHPDNRVGKPRKRAASQTDSDESSRSPSAKHAKPDSCPSPPAPKRATLVSQRHQFKKLVAPFRPPSKVPIGKDRPSKTNEVERTVSAKPAANHDVIEIKGPTSRPYSRNKATNTSRPVSQFKSPLISRTLPAESRTIRLTPALQALERKLQLLKRAVKVKEEKEEETLTKLVRKWIEAGREVAYDIWDATKEAGNFEANGKAAFSRRSRGWDSVDNGKTSWGWDSKSEDTNDESSGLDSSTLYCAARSVLEGDEEDDFDVCHNTLGTMLRQLGIAPEIFGWDDEQELFL